MAWRGSPAWDEGYWESCTIDYIKGGKESEKNDEFMVNGGSDGVGHYVDYLISSRNPRENHRNGGMVLWFSC